MIGRLASRVWTPGPSLWLVAATTRGTRALTTRMPSTATYTMLLTRLQMRPLPESGWSATRVGLSALLVCLKPHVPQLLTSSTAHSDSGSTPCYFADSDGSVLESHDDVARALVATVACPTLGTTDPTWQRTFAAGSQLAFKGPTSYPTPYAYACRAQPNDLFCDEHLVGRSTPVRMPVLSPQLGAAYSYRPADAAVTSAIDKSNLMSPAFGPVWRTPCCRVHPRWGGCSTPLA
jgi:hypothetical protein